MSEKERWVDVQGYEGLYQVSNLGEVKGLPRFVKYTNGGTRFWDGGVLKPYANKRGYSHINLCKEGKITPITIHRLVALHFVEGYADNLQVNHLDENKHNNRASNLEWITHKENINYGTCVDRRVEKTSKPIKQLSKKGEFINYWKSAHDI